MEKRITKLIGPRIDDHPGDEREKPQKVYGFRTNYDQDEIEILNLRKRVIANPCMEELVRAWLELHDVGDSYVK